MLRKMTAMLFVTVLLVLPCLMLSALAQEGEEMVYPRYTYIDSISGSLDIENGKAICFGTGRSRYSDSTTVLQVVLQKRTPNSNNWSQVSVWNNSTVGRNAVYISEEKSVSAGYDYRIFVKCMIKDSLGIIKEMDSIYSRMIHY